MKNIRPVSNTVSQSTITSVKSVLTNPSTTVTSPKVLGVSTIEHSKTKFYTPTVTNPLASRFGILSSQSTANSPTSKIADISSLVNLRNAPLTNSKVDLLADTYINQFVGNQKSFSDLPDSILRPKVVSKDFFFQGALAGTFVKALKAGLSTEEAFAYAIYAYGSPGVNFKALQAMIAPTIGNHRTNMIPYIPQSLVSTLSPETIKELSHMDLRNGSLYLEMRAMVNINRDLQFPLERYSSLATVTNGPGIQNLTTNACPDFLRKFSESIAGITEQYYDQKSGRSSMSNQNHLRPVSDNLGNTVIQAENKLKNSVLTWMYKTNNRGHDVANSLLEDLNAISQHYQETKIATVYASAYNKFREKYNVFLTENGVPMNLVTEVGIDQLSLNKDSVTFFQETYINMCYSKSSSWVQFLNAYIAKNNGVINDYPEVIKEFAIKEFDNFTML